MWWLRADENQVVTSRKAFLATFSSTASSNTTRPLHLICRDGLEKALSLVSWQAQAVGLLYSATHATTALYRYEYGMNLVPAFGGVVPPLCTLIVAL